MGVLTLTLRQVRQANLSHARPQVSLLYLRAAAAVANLNNAIMMLVLL
jgi:hypothetical protein